MITSSGSGAAGTHYIVYALILRLCVIYSNMFKLLAQKKDGINWKGSQVTQYK